MTCLNTTYFKSRLFRFTTEISTRFCLFNIKWWLEIAIGRYLRFLDHFYHFWSWLFWNTLLAFLWLEILKAEPERPPLCWLLRIFMSTLCAPWSCCSPGDNCQIRGDYCPLIMGSEEPSSLDLSSSSSSSRFEFEFELQIQWNFHNYL